VWPSRLLGEKHEHRAHGRKKYTGRQRDCENVPKSSAYRQVSRVIFAPRADITGRPLTPLHGGHVGLLCTAGMLNRVFGEGESQHIAHWQSIKLVNKSEEQEDGKSVIREKERFSNELTLVFSSGEIAILK